MKTKLLLRIASGCLLFFALGHSIGHIKRHDVTDPIAQKVLEQMIVNKFDMFGQLRSYDENYTGMSTNLIVTLLTFVCILWIVSSHTEKNTQLIKNILIPIAISILGFSITSFLYFFMLPAITCLIAFVLISISIWKLSKYISQ